MSSARKSFITVNESGNPSYGDVAGPGTVVDSQVVVFDGTTGKAVKSAGFIAEGGPFRLNIGNSVINTAVNSVAVGGGIDQTGAIGNGHTAVGAFAKALGATSVAVGNSAEVQGGSSAIAIGNTTRAVGDGDVVIGSLATTLGATGDRNIVIGQQGQATGTDSVCVGYNTRALAGTSSVAIGPTATASVANGVAVGSSADAVAGGAISIGRASYASGSQAVTVGDGSTAAGNFSTACGPGATATGLNSIALGSGASASHQDGIALGNGALTTATSKFGVGPQNLTAVPTTGEAVIDKWWNVNVDTFDYKVPLYSTIGANPTFEYGSLHVNAGAGLPVVFADSTNYVEMAASTWTVGSLLTSFNEVANGRLQYTGAETKIAFVSVQLSFTTASNNQIIHLRLAKNGVTIADTETARKTGTGADVGAMADAGLISLAPNDYISLFARNESWTGAGDTLTPSTASMTAVCFSIA